MERRPPISRSRGLQKLCQAIGPIRAGRSSAPENLSARCVRSAQQEIFPYGILSATRFKTSANLSGLST